MKVEGVSNSGPGFEATSQPEDALRPVDTSSDVSTINADFSSELAGDAAVVSVAAQRLPLSDTRPVVSLDSRAEDDTGSKEDEKSLSLEQREENEKLAKTLESKLNETEVRFQVALTDDDSGTKGPRFQVVEKETGDVIREFPPDAAKKAIQASDTSGDLKGILLALEA